MIFIIPLLSKLERCTEKLKDSIKIVEKLAQKNGFKFSISKTSMLHFTKLSIPPPNRISTWQHYNSKV